MKMSPGVLLIGVLAHGLAGCGGSSLPSTPAVPSPVQQPAPQPTPFQVTGRVSDTANRWLPGASVEVLTGPQAGTSTTADAAGAFSLSGAFDGTTRFRATKEGYVTATQGLTLIGTTKSIFFSLEVAGGSVNIAGNYTVTFMADSACADQLPVDVRTRTYPATIRPDSSTTRPANTFFVAALSGSSLDGYFSKMAIFVAGEDLVVDLSDNSILEEVGEGRYLSIGGMGEASLKTSGVGTISVSLNGTFDYCVTESEMKSGYSCPSDQAIARAQCYSKNHRLVLTQR
jgi:hypothetical protein